MIRALGDHNAVSYIWRSATQPMQGQLSFRPYSSIWIAGAGADDQASSVAADAKHPSRGGGEHRRSRASRSASSVLRGEALAVPPAGGARGTRLIFDLVFVDAEKGNDARYLRLAREMVRSGARVSVDQVVRGGKLVGARPVSQEEWGGMGSRAVGKDSRGEGVELQTASEKTHDGFWMLVVK